MATGRVAQALVQIPKRVARGPTDILKVLASTVKFEPSQVHYQYGLDPFLLPTNDRDRLHFALAFQSGRKTARYLLDKHPELFYRDDAEPKIESFAPPEKFTDTIDLDESDLRWCIDKRDMNNAKIAFDKLKKDKNLDAIDLHLLYDLHEMTCFFNERDPLSPWDRERLIYDIDPSDDLVDKTWITDGLAKELFEYLRSRDDRKSKERAYSVQIMGLSRHNEHNEAWKLYYEMVNDTENLGGPVEMYNLLLRNVDTIDSSSETGWARVESLVDRMNQFNLSPHLNTFNSILKTISSYMIDASSIEKTLKLLNEMFAHDISPSLATYYYVLKIVRRYRRSQNLSQIFENILTDIEEELRNRNSHGNKLLQLRDPDDTQFLSFAMMSCLNDLASVKMAHRVHAIYEYNPNLVGSSHFSRKYLNDYFRIVISMEPLEKTLQLYRCYVPTTFVPAANVYDALLDAVELHDGNEAIIELIASDIVRFKLTDRVKNHSLLKQNKTYMSNLDGELKRIILAEDTEISEENQISLPKKSASSNRPQQRQQPKNSQPEKPKNEQDSLIKSLSNRNQKRLNKK